MPAPDRITVGTECVSGGSLDFFVQTGSLEDPLVTIADNNGFPLQCTLYARPCTTQSLHGIHVSVIFQGSPPTGPGPGFAVNIWQPSMKGPHTVIPRPTCT